MTAPTTLISCSVFLLALSGLFGVLNIQQTRGARVRMRQGEGIGATGEERRFAHEKELQGREMKVAAANTRLAETRTKVAGTEAELIKTQTENNSLQARVRDYETQIAQLTERVADAEERAAAGAISWTASTAELRAQLEEASKQLDLAEREKVLLSDGIKASRDRSTKSKTETKRRPPAGGNPGIRGRVLAVNRAYNFVVLNLGGRQGVEANTEMLVMRGGSFIAKIRVSSVEPATTIGDIITTSLARGVQVQPGDTVVYGGTNF